MRRDSSNGKRNFDEKETCHWQFLCIFSADNNCCDFPIVKNFSNIFCEYIIKDKFNCACMFYYKFNNNIIIFDINGIGRILYFDENKKLINLIKNVDLINENNN